MEHLLPVCPDFQNLYGTSGNIQQQLDDKLHSYTPLAANRNLLVLNGTTLTGTSTSIITFDTSGNSEVDNSPQIPVIEPSNHNGVEFQNLYQAYSGPFAGVSNSIANYNVPLLDTVNGVAYRSTMQNFLELSIADDGGITNNSTNHQLQMNIQGLPDYSTPSSLNYEDFVGIGLAAPPVNSTNNRITLRNLLSVPIHPNITSATYYTGALAFFTNQGGTSYLGVATGNGTSWYGISGIDII